MPGAAPGPPYVGYVDPRIAYQQMSFAENCDHAQKFTDYIKVDDKQSLVRCWTREHRKLSKQLRGNIQQTKYIIGLE